MRAAFSMGAFVNEVITVISFRTLVVLRVRNMVAVMREYR